MKTEEDLSRTQRDISFLNTTIIEVIKEERLIMSVDGPKGYSNILSIPLREEIVYLKEFNLQNIQDIKGRKILATYRGRKLVDIRKGK